MTQTGFRECANYKTQSTICSVKSALDTVLNYTSIIIEELCNTITVSLIVSSLLSMQPVTYVVLGLGALLFLNGKID